LDEETTENINEDTEEADDASDEELE